jgi:excisionase family DNA binding protein
VNDQLMNIETVAEYLDIPRATIYNWGSRGLGPQRYRVGRHVRFRREEVEAWLQAQAVGSIGGGGKTALAAPRSPVRTGPGGRAASERRHPVGRPGDSRARSPQRRG